MYSVLIKKTDDFSFLIHCFIDCLRRISPNFRHAALAQKHSRSFSFRPIAVASGELWRSIILFTVLIFKILILSHRNRTLFLLFATMSNYLSTELSYFFSIITQNWQPYRRCLTYRTWNWILIHYLQYSSIQPHSKTPFIATFDFFPSDYKMAGFLILHLSHSLLFTKSSSSQYSFWLP